MRIFKGGDPLIYIAAGHTSKHAGLTLDRVLGAAALIAGPPADSGPPHRTGRVVYKRIARRLADRLASIRLADLTRDRAQPAPTAYAPPACRPRASTITGPPVAPSPAGLGRTAGPPP